MGSHLEELKDSHVDSTDDQRNDDYDDDDREVEGGEREYSGVHENESEENIAPPSIKKKKKTTILSPTRQREELVEEEDVFIECGYEDVDSFDVFQKNESSTTEAELRELENFVFQTPDSRARVEEVKILNAVPEQKVPSRDRNRTSRTPSLSTSLPAIPENRSIVTYGFAGLTPYVPTYSNEKMNVSQVSNKLRKMSSTIEGAALQINKLATGDKYLDTQTSNIIKKLRALPQMKESSIVLSHKQLKDQGALALLQILQEEKYMNSVKELLLDDNFLTPLSAIPIITYCRINANVTRLDLSNNNLGSKSSQLINGSIGPALKALIRENSTLKELNLDSNHIGDECMKYIADALCENFFLSSITLSHNELSFVSGELIKQILVINGDLRELNLGWNKLGTAGTMSVLEGLHGNNVLKKINLSWNGISDKGGVAVGNLIYDNTSLEMIDVSHNRISQDGASKIAEGITQNQVIKKLVLSHNPLGDVGVSMIIKSLRENSSIETIDMQGCQSGDAANEEIGETIKKRRNNLQILFSFSSLPQPDFASDKLEFHETDGPKIKRKTK